MQSLRDIDDVVTHTLNFDDRIDVVHAAVVVRITLLEAVDLVVSQHCAVVVDRDLAINCNLEVLGENGLAREVFDHHSVGVINQREQRFDLADLLCRE